MSASRIYPIVDPAALGPIDLEALVELFGALGIEWVQLRDKLGSDRDRFERACSMCAACARVGIDLWINDRVDLAVLTGARAVHLGQTDLPPAVARALAPRLLVGQSTHTPGEARAAEADPAVDVVAIGPVFATRSKVDHSLPIGIEGVTAMRRLVGKPLVAIGGIDATTAAAVCAAGADRVAIIAALGSGSLAVVEKALGDIIAAFRRAERSEDGPRR